jgi:excisionase family DNA binding protein
MDANTSTGSLRADVGLRPLLVDPKQAARLLGIGRTKLYELIGAGTLRPMRIGRCVRFSVADLERFVANGCVADHEAPLASAPAPTLDRTDARPRRSRVSAGSQATLRLFDPAS